MGQSDMVNEVEVIIEAKIQKKRLLEREVDAWNSKLAIVNDQITSLREKEKHVLQEMENVKKRERAEHASVIAAERTLKEKQTNLKRKEYQRSNALDKLNSAIAEKDKQLARYKAVERSYNYHKREHEKKKERSKWAWAVPFYNIY